MWKSNRLGIILCIGLLGLSTGCGESRTTASKTSGQTAGVQEVLQQGMAEAETDEEAQEQEETSAQIDESEQESGTDPADSTPVNPEPTDAAQEEEPISPGTTEGVDVDLTTLSATMVYSEVSNMMINPDQYMGKTVKMQGIENVYHDTETGQDYYACVIADATACCSQGIEFEMADKIYPPEGSEVTVMGVFDTYEENGYQYCTLRGAQLAE